MDSDLRKDKVKRMKRIGQKARNVQHNLKNNLALFGKQSYIKAQKEPHRLAEYNGMSCSNPYCMGCRNPRKIFGELTMQERKFYQKYDGDESPDDYESSGEEDDQ